MRMEYDFSRGVRGKFHNSDGELNLPIYLEPEVAEFVQKDTDLSQAVNRLLEKDM